MCRCVICNRKRAQPQINQDGTNCPSPRTQQDGCSSCFPCLQWSRQYWVVCRQGELGCWKAFLLEADEEVLAAMASLGTTHTPSDDTMEALEKFVCQVYLANTPLTTVKDLRWHLFRKKEATQGALRQAVLRTHH